MIIVKGRTIQMSCGDTFQMIFAVCGYQLEENDRAVLCVKNAISDNTPRLELEAVADTINNFLVFMDLENRAALLGVGEYVYDVRLDTATGEHITLTYPSRFIVKEVVHND